MSLIFVDVEGHGPAPGLNDVNKFEFGAVEYKTEEVFYGKDAQKQTFVDFALWLKQFEGSPVFISDNNGYDYQFINYYFWLHLNCNPFGHSSRRISDIYSGCIRNMRNGTKWKKWRITPHDHNPVNDAKGNVEAFKKIVQLFGME